MSSKLFLFLFLFCAIFHIPLESRADGDLGYSPVFNQLKCGPKHLSFEEMRTHFSNVNFYRGADDEELKVTYFVGSCVQSLLTSLPHPDGLEVNIIKNKNEGTTILGSMSVSVPFVTRSRPLANEDSKIATVAALLHEWSHPYLNESIWPGINRLRIDIFKNNEPVLGFYINTPYLELFADTVAVVATGNPRITTEVGSTEEERDFSQDMPQTFLEKYLPMMAKKRDLNRYNFFQPTKVFLWRKVLKNLRTPEDRVEALAKIAAAIKAEVQFNISSSLSNLSFKEHNKRLISQISKNF